MVQNFYEVERPEGVSHGAVVHRGGVFAVVTKTVKLVVGLVITRGAVIAVSIGFLMNSKVIFQTMKLKI